MLGGVVFSLTAKRHSYSPETTRRAPQVIRTVYYDQSLSEPSAELLEAAMDAWTEATGGAVVWRVKGHQARPDVPFIGDCGETVRVSEALSTDPIAIAIALKSRDPDPGVPVAWTLWGCRVTSVIFFTDKFDDKSNFYKVALHELGHVIGLDHDKSDELTVMHHLVEEQASCITERDLKQFCNRVGCEDLVLKACSPASAEAEISFSPQLISP